MWCYVHWQINGAGAGALNSFQTSNVNYFNTCPSSGGQFPDGKGPCNNANWQKWQTGASGGVGTLGSQTTKDLTELNEGNYSLEIYYETKGV